MKNGSDEEYLETGGQAFDQSDDVFEKNFGSKKSKDDSDSDPDSDSGSGSSSDSSFDGESSRGRGRSGSSRGERNDSRNADAKSILGGAEGAAAGEDNDGAEGGINPVRAIENTEGKNKDGFNYVGGKLTSKVKGKKSKKGPIITIFATLCIFATLTVGTATLRPFAFVSNLQEQYNVMRTAMNDRHHRMIKFQMKKGRSTGSSLVFGDELKISPEMQKRLRKNGIEYKEDSDGNRFLVFTDGDTEEVYFVTANNDDVSSIPDSTDVDGVTKRASKKMTIDTAMNDSKNFYNAENTATRTVKGHFAGWFESRSNMFHKRISALRNKFGKLGKNATDEEIIDSAKKSGLAEKSGGTSGVVEAEDDDYIDDNGNGKEDPGERGTTPVGDDSLDSSADPATAQEKLTNRGMKAAAAVEAGADIFCGIQQGITAMNMAVSAIQIAKILNFVTGYLEAVQKTQAGYGGSELAYYEKGYSAPGDTENVNGELVKKGTTAAGSRPYNTFFGGAAVSFDDDIAQKYNRDMFMANAILIDSRVPIPAAIAGMSSLEAYQTCNIATMLSSAANGIVALVVPGGAFAEGLIKWAVKEAAMAAIGVIMTALIPKVAAVLAKDLITDIAGEDVAYALNSGANIYLGKQMQANSGGVGTEEKIAEMYKHTQEVIAREAEYERSIKSPFDITSKNTFFGSIAYSMIPIGIALETSSIGAISKTVAAASGSLTSLFPSVNAASKSTWFNLSHTRKCPTLSVYAPGDAYCSPYYVTDYSTMDMDPYDVYASIADQFDGETNGNPNIMEDSDFAKYIVACTTRDSQYGLADAKITSFVSNPTDTGLDSVINMVFGAVPVIGDFFRTLESAINSALAKWNTGQACIADPAVNPDWEQNKYYQRYIEDQTYMEAEGIIEKSSITAFLEKYYEKNPIDNSLEGIIAQYSGMSYEQVDYALGLMEYAEFVANYDPTDKYPSPAEKQDEYQFEYSQDFQIAKIDIVLLNLNYAYAVKETRETTI